MRNRIEHPKVFISYAWGSEDYKIKVLSFATDLMNDGTLIPKSVVTLYQWINEGVLRTSNLDLLSIIELIRELKGA